MARPYPVAKTAYLSMQPVWLLLFVSFALAAQTPRAQGHAYFGLDNPPHGSFRFNSVGTGADIFVYKDLAVSPSIGYLYSREDSQRGVAIFTANGSYHFLRGKSRFEPFVIAGYGAIADLGHGLSLFNYGGGGQYWFRKRLGVRVEVLNFQHSQYRELTSVRFGIAFR